MKHYLTVKDLPEDERPYEKCERLGASRLSDAELLAVILRTGVRGQRSTDLEYEQAVVVMLDGKNRFAGDFLLSKGTVKASLVSPREMFREAMKAGAVYVILLHNHPSGDPTPSSQDISTTKRVKTTGEILDIPLLDHIIIGDHKYVSLKEMGLF